MSADMRRHYVACLVVLVALAATPLAAPGNSVINFLVVALMIGLAGQAWNLLAGYCGQFSFGHAVFFGTGAYMTAILQVHYGVNAWAAFVAGIAAGAAVGLFIGVSCFRLGVRGSYFALITLAFAEVARILASTLPVTGAGSGLLVPLDVRAGNFQFDSRLVFFYIALTLVAISMALVAWIANTRFGARLAAVRENEYAAAALGVNTFVVKLQAIALSGAIAAAAGGFYTQYFLYLDAGIAYGAWISLEALLAPLVGGIGTVLGPVVGALLLHGLGETAKHATGDLPGVDLVLYGVVLVLVVRFAPRGVAGLWRPGAMRRPAGGTS